MFRLRLAKMLAQLPQTAQLLLGRGRTRVCAAVAAIRLTISVSRCCCDGASGSYRFASISVALGGSWSGSAIYGSVYDAMLFVKFRSELGAIADLRKRSTSRAGISLFDIVIEINGALGFDRFTDFALTVFNA